jgi:hypothetical protein
MVSFTLWMLYLQSSLIVGWKFELGERERERGGGEREREAF